MQPILTTDAGVLRIAETREVIEELQADRANGMLFFVGSCADIADLHS